jgi:hypothetical protein
MTSDEAMKLCDKHASQISEMLEDGAVQILCSWVEDGMTNTIVSGSGNWNARVGMARRMVEKDSAETLAHEISRRINPPDEGEGWKK